VVIPVYNSEKTVWAAIESVLAQSYTDHEILVMDDGSTDATGSVLDSFGGSIRLFRQSNRGVAAARNELLKRASGKYVAFIDIDDIWHKQYLDIQVKTLDHYSEAVGSFTRKKSFTGLGEFSFENDVDFEVDRDAAVVEKRIFLREHSINTGRYTPLVLMIRAEKLQPDTNNTFPSICVEWKISICFIIFY